jgi:hypothetical protein
VLEPAAEAGGAAVADWDARGASVLACGLRRRLAASWLKDAPGRCSNPQPRTAAPRLDASLVAMCALSYYPMDQHVGNAPFASA